MLHLRMGVTDCYINSRISIYWELERLTKAGEIRPADRPDFAEGAAIGTQSGYLGFSSRGGESFPFQDDFLKQFNAIIRKMKESGGIQQIQDRWIKMP